MLRKTAAKYLPSIRVQRRRNIFFVFFAAQLLPKINMELWFRALETRRGQKQLICKSRPPGSPLMQEQGGHHATDPTHRNFAPEFQPLQRTRGCSNNWR